MTTKPPTEQDLPTLAPAPEITPLKLDSSPITNPTTPSATSKETLAAATSKPHDPPSTAADIVYIPTYSRWFSWDNILVCEVRFLPEFFDGRSPSKNPRVYKYYRNTIIRKLRENPTTKITFTEARKTMIGDVGSVRRVFDFLETWGLVNYSPGPASKLPLKWEEKETKSNTALSQSTQPTGNSVEPTVPKKRLCCGCKTVCSIACFACDKYDLTLCARCYVRGNYRVGVNSTEFRRVEINEEIKTYWTEKEILHLLEAIMHYSDDWKRVAELVGRRSEIECVTTFIKRPFGEQFVGASDSTDVNKKFYQMEDQNNAEFGLQSFGKSFANKRMRPSPLADASNPIVAQASFLSALVGVEVAEVAASAAVKALAEFSYGAIKETPGFLSSHARQQGHDVDTTLKTLEGPLVDVKSQLRKEEQDLE
ncbi:SWI/SNF complex subunit isoform 2 [Actinidia chinensis var. chinensis]|uniref:SWI/SNF complex subunit isoform 2 n=1 Tax=Actinidia chinensis var. chinensis TaxID=1590841 RepID=A0A2R6PZ89_ACTCC|nr:SWI/SNF complex subunit isoform 2 [Actinidia chinensis var. chinensis]